MKTKTTDLIEEIKKVLEKHISGKEISTFIKKINSSQKHSDELITSQLRLVTDQIISFTEKKLPIFNFLNFLKDLGKLYISYGELELASDISNTIISYTKKDKRLSSITAYAFLNFGEIFIQQAMWSESTSYIKKAFSFFYKENDPVGLARCESLMGTLYAEKGQLSDAMTHFNKGFSYVETSKDVSVA